MGIQRRITRFDELVPPNKMLHLLDFLDVLAVPLGFLKTTRRKRDEEDDFGDQFFGKAMGLSRILKSISFRVAWMRCHDEFLRTFRILLNSGRHTRII
jgi:hypothetical protein